MRKVIVKEIKEQIFTQEEYNKLLEKLAEKERKRREKGIFVLSEPGSTPRMYKTATFFVYLITNEVISEPLKEINDPELLQQYQDCKIYLIKELGLNEWLDEKYINQIKRKYENRPNLWERIFGFKEVLKTKVLEKLDYREILVTPEIMDKYNLQDCDIDDQTYLCDFGPTKLYLYTDKIHPELKELDISSLPNETLYEEDIEYIEEHPGRHLYFLKELSKDSYNLEYINKIKKQYNWGD